MDENNIISNLVLNPPPPSPRSIPSRRSCKKPAGQDTNAYRARALQNGKLGWAVLERECGGGKVLSHGGDNMMNFANVWIAPARNFAVLACVNQSGDSGFAATDEAVSGLVGLVK